MAFPVNADILTVVDLTKEQTLALYGTTIQGNYYTGSEWRSCTFEYFADSSEFSTGDYITSITGADFTGYTSDQITSLLRNNQFLFYRCAVPSPSPASGDLQFDLTFSTDIKGIAYFRQIVACAMNFRSFNTLEQSDFPKLNYFYTSNTVSYSASPVVFGGKGLESSRYLGYFQTFIMNPEFESSIVHPNARFSFSDIYLQDLDSQTGQENTFSISGQQFVFQNAYQYSFPVDENQWQIYYIIAISTPRVTDGYVLPEPPETSPSPVYSGQLSNIYEGIEANTTLLQAILAKLDMTLSTHGTK